MDTSFNELRKKWLLLSVLKYKRLLISEAYLEPFQTPMMKLFLNIVNGFSFYFRQNVSSQMFGSDQNRPLNNKDFYWQALNSSR